MVARGHSGTEDVWPTRRSNQNRSPRGCVVAVIFEYHRRASSASSALARPRQRRFGCGRRRTDQGFRVRRLGHERAFERLPPRCGKGQVVVCANPVNFRIKYTSFPNRTVRQLASVHMEITGPALRCKLAANKKTARRRSLCRLSRCDQAKRGAAFLRYAMKPSPKKPAIINTQVEGSGTAPTSPTEAVVIFKCRIGPGDFADQSIEQHEAITLLSKHDAAAGSERHATPGG